MNVSLSCKRQRLCCGAPITVTRSCSGMDSLLASSMIARGKKISLSHHGARKVTSTVTRANFRTAIG
jgi:hypothetical protein